MHMFLNSVKVAEKAVMSSKMIEWEAAINSIKYGNFCRHLWTGSHRLAAYPKLDALHINQKKILQEDLCNS